MTQAPRSPTVGRSQAYCICHMTTEDLEITPEDDLDQDPPRNAWRSLAFFAVTAVFMAVDVVSDLLAHTAPGHIVLEIFLGGLALGGVFYFSRQALREQRERRAVSLALAHAERESERWRREADTWRREAKDALSGLASAIDRQFKRWELTAAEGEVALLLLKGLSHKEAAELRGTSERTVRQQALTVYRKANVAGRAELSAFFLEDLLLPDKGA
ncbi:MAG: helix-turn-helix transcriptional regulator [Deltaproteobacteria bacterium]|nr:helix-turn-helix transcriptional regulator [Deltaproteobacteria bacterium]